MSKKYSRQALLDAVASGLDSKAAAVEFQVPASTIREHRRNPTILARSGRPSYLTTEQEAHFVCLLKLLPEYGFDLALDLTLQLACDYFEQLGLSIRPGAKWLRAFVCRHSEDLKWKRQEKLERARAEGFSEETRQGWFATLKATLIKHDLMDKPNQIFNADETGFSDKTKGEKLKVS